MRETWLQLSALDLLNLDTFNVFTDEPNVSVPEISKIGRLLGKCVNGKIEKMDVIWNDVLKDGSDEILPIDFNPNAQSLVLMSIVVIGIYLGFKREFSKLIGFLVVALIAVGLVFNAGGVKDVLLELFNKIIGA